MIKNDNLTILSKLCFSFVMDMTKMFLINIVNTAKIFANRIAIFETFLLYAAENNNNQKIQTFICFRRKVLQRSA